MARSVQMPPLGESVTEGTVSRWLKKVGDRVEVDEPLVEVTTDKVDTEIPSPFAGTLERIVVGEDESAEVGAELALIADGAPVEPEVVSTPEDPEAARQAPDSVAEEVTPQEITPDADAPDADAPDADAPGGAEGPAGQAAPAPPGATEPAAADADASATAGDAPDGDAPVPSGGAPSSSGTPVEIYMPALGESVTEGTVTRWLVSVGDAVTVDQPLLEVSTDKVDTEVPSPVAGTITEIAVSEDETVAVGAVLARVGDAAADTQARTDEQPTSVESSTAAPAPGDRAPEGAASQPAPPSQRSADESPATAPESLDEVTVERLSAERPTEETTAPPTSPAPTNAVPVQTPAPSAEAGGYVTPIVRKLAAELDVDLSSVTGTGVGGRIRRQDVTAAAQAATAARAAAEQQAAAEAAAAAAPTGPAPTTPAAPTPDTPTPAAAPTAEVSAKRGTTEPMSRTRKVIAARMMASLQTSAQLTTVVEVDVTRVARLRTRSKAAFEAREGVKLSFLPFFALAAVEALKVHPILNASTDGESITYHHAENLGIAVDTERGLMVPVIADAGDLNLAGLARRIFDLAERTRARKVSPDDLSGSTFTLTNTGSRGALFDTPIINQPEVGILGTGAVVKRPVVLTDADGAEGIAVRSMVYLALSYDHRIVDGADAARFLVTIKTRLEDGAFESDLGL